MKLRLFAFALLLAFTASPVHADLVVTSEDFDTAGDSGAEPGGFAIFGFPTTIAGWGESFGGSADPGNNPDRFSDFLGPTGNGIVGESGNAAGIEAGYIYREIGTQSSFSSIEIGGRNLSRPGAGQKEAIIVDLIALDSTDTFAFAEFGNDVVDATSATLVGGFLSAAPGADDLPEAFSFSYDTSGVADGSRLFVRLSSFTGANGYVDDLTFTAVAVPEPTSFLALGLVGIAALTRRKR